MHRNSGGKHSLTAAIERHDTATLFDWLVQALSYQGIADRIAYDYMQRHGQARWARIRASLARNPSCPKLGGYWRFYDCRYRKGSATCAEPRHIAACPLPRQPLRNGHLNQMAYSLFLFMRDVADGDLVGWIDAQLGSVNFQSVNRLAALREAIIGPLRNVYGVADKVLAMALADLLLSAGRQRPLWREVGATWWRSTPWCIISCTEPESCGGWAPSIPTASAATGPADALTFSVASLPTLMLASSIRPCDSSVAQPQKTWKPERV